MIPGDRGVGQLPRVGAGAQRAAGEHTGLRLVVWESGTRRTCPQERPRAGPGPGGLSAVSETHTSASRRAWGFSAGK